MIDREMNEAVIKVYRILLERFGEPLPKEQQTVGIADEGPGGKTTYDEDPKEGDWNNPKVFREARGKRKKRGGKRPKVR